MDMVSELKKDGLLLKKIPKKEQTVEMCKIAIKQNPLALQFVAQKCLDYKLCLAAVKKNEWAFQYVPSKFTTKEMCELAVNADPKLLKYVPEDFRTTEICMRAIKENVGTLSYVSWEKRQELFDDNTEIKLIERIVAQDSTWLKYMPNRSDVRGLCIKCMEEDFSVAKNMSEQIKVSDDILTYQKSKGKLYFVKKYYDSSEKKLEVEVKVIYGQYSSQYDENKMIEESYNVIVEFDDFNKFYDFLNGDLFDAELGSYDFAGIDLKKYTIDGAVINSDILQSQGLYDGTYYSAVKKHMEDNSEYIFNNEIMISNEFYYPKPVDGVEHKIFDDTQIPFFYISDIHLVHQVCNRFDNRATKEEIRSYIKQLAREMRESIGNIPINSYLLIAGDVSSIFEFTSIFYNELVQQWLWSSKNIIVVAGNHELWDPWVSLEKSIEIYRNFFDNLGITFLQNDLLYVEYGKEYGVIHEKELLEMSEEAIKEVVQYSSVIILGGVGFSGLNKGFNASNIRYGKSFDELSRDEALQKDIQEANRFNIIYTKLLSSLYRNRVIVLTHTEKGDWNAEAHNPHWIYLNGHNHHNFYEVNDKHAIYADNQIGYRAKNIGLKYFYCDNEYDIFVYYQDGIHEITKEQYIDFYRGKKIFMSFNRDRGTIYMLKRDTTYMFLIYCMYSKRSNYESLYLLNGGKLERLERNSLDDLSYYYDNIEKYTKNVNQLLHKYAGGQKKLAEFVKRIGGSGKIHGCIVDVERPNNFRGFSYCHLFVNPIDGKVTPYFAFDVKSRIVYKDFKTLLQAHDSCKIMANNYLQLERESTQNLPVFQYSSQMEEWGDGDSMYDEGTYLYRISQIISSLKYHTAKNIVRLWNEELLNYDFIARITQASHIDELLEDRLMIDEKNI